MDVTPTPESEDLTQLFDLSPEGFPWDDRRVEDIKNRRADMSDLLIFDILLLSGEVRQPSALWPPTDVASLQRLLAAIEQSKYDGLKKDCLIYFLLKSFQDDREASFKETRCIPPQFSALSDAFWHLDTGINVEYAISLLADVRLNRDYTSKILEAISLDEDSARLIVKYIRTVKPILTEPDDLDIYVVALAQSSIMEAWHFQRTFPESNGTRTRLIRKILGWALSPTPKEEPLVNLLAFPFSLFEQSLLHAYALDPPSEVPSSSIPALQQLACVRLIHSGHYAEAIKLDREFGSGTRASAKAAAERRKIMDELLAVMPSVERQQIEEELAAQGHNKAKINGPTHAAAALEKPKMNGAGADLSMSWEEVSSPNAQLASAASGSKPFTLGRPATGGPRFHAPNGPRRSLNGASPDRFAVSGRNLFAPPSPGNTSAPSSSHIQLPILPVSSKSPPNAGVRFTSNGPSRSNGVAAPPLFRSKLPANQAPNAFYNPPLPPKTKPTYPTFQFATEEDDAMRVDAPAPAAYNSHDDASMNTDDTGDVDLALDITGPGTGPDAGDTDAEPSAVRSEFSQSVFAAGPSAQHSRNQQPSFERLPPGAFHDSDHDDYADNEPVSVRQARVRTPSPPPPAKTRIPVRVRKTPKRTTRDPTLKRSLPGAFTAMGDDEDERLGQGHGHGNDNDDGGEDDEIAPLPKRPLRRGRATRPSASSVDGEDDAEVRPVRRSSRLSVASSSPEPMSPQKLSTGTSGRTRKAASTTATPGKTRSSRRR